MCIVFIADCRLGQSIFADEDVCQAKANNNVPNDNMMVIIMDM